MPDLVVIQLAPGVMTENLETSLSQTGRKPWGFNKFLSSMNGFRPGVHVAFLRLTLPDGRPIGKQGAYPPDAVVHRAVLGTLDSSVSETPSPFFAGFPQQFWFDLITDEEFGSPVDLTTASAFLNDQCPGLGIDADKLCRLLSNARSAKAGMYFDGEPRLADYFKGRGSPATTPRPVQPAPPAQQPSTPPRPTTVDPLAEAVDGFISSVKASGLVFAGINEDLPRAFLSGLMAKRFVLLTGLSGSGKTQLARAFGQWLGSSPEGRRHLVTPVRADWTTPDPLLGYEDALLPTSPDGARAWNVPAALEFMLRARSDPHHSYALVLDEMNLAHVERYFADVLSGMESGEPILPNLERPDGGRWYPVPGAPSLVPLPANLFVIGTVNIDETTYQFSPKVLDRSFSFEFRVTTDELDGSLRPLDPIGPGEPAHLAMVARVSGDPEWHLTNPCEAQTEVEALLVELHELLSPIGLEFGHRSYREALRMAAILAGSGVTAYEDIADWVVMSKVLPRIHGSRRQLEPFLQALKSLADGDDPDKPVHPLIARKTDRMLDTLRTNQYAGFAE